jgi:PIN domain nuclease of toxin-antitoxin system
MTKNFWTAEMYLLDSHTFLWSVFDSKRLSKTVQDIVLDTAGDIFVSTITFWELSLKYEIGKLELDRVKPDAFPGAAKEAGFIVLPLDSMVAASFHQLPTLAHRDPLDRLLVWQAIRGGLTLVSCDSTLNDYKDYGLQLLW